MSLSSRGVQPRRFLFLFSALIAALLLVLPSSAQADILHGLGIMGDSGSVNSPSYKWPVQLQTNRGLNFGGSGLPYDHAVSGATSSSLLSGHQDTQMSADIGAGKVTLGMIFIGNNDWGSSTGLAIAAGTATPTQQTTFQNAVINNIKTAVNTELTAGVQGFIIGGVEDVTLTPQAMSMTSDPAAIARVRNSISIVNTQVASFAHAHHLPFVNFFGLGDAVATSGLIVGGVNITLTGSGSNAHNFWLDGLHPGIVGNAIIGNMWMEAMNIAYGTHLALYTDQQILALAGLSASYTGETFSTSYNLANYIQYTPVPEPSTLVLATLAIPALLWCRFRRARR